MSLVRAKSHANSVKNKRDVGEKLDLLAQAIYEMARSLEDIQKKVNLIESQTG